MATSYPTALDALQNPVGSTSLGSYGPLSHSAQHANANDAIEAIQLKLGINNSSDTNSIDNILRTLKTFVDNITTADVAEDITAQYFTNDRAYNAIKDALSNGTHADIVFTYNDLTKTFNLAISSQVATKEYVDDAVSTLNNSLPITYVPLSAIASADGVASLGPDSKIPDGQIPSGITRDTELAAGVVEAKSYAAAQDLIVLAQAAADATEKATEAEETAVGTAQIYTDSSIASTLSSAAFINQVEDLAAGIITSGTHTGITVAYNNTTNTLNLTATYDDDEVVTAIATALTAGNGITKVFDDSLNTITVSVDTSVIATQTYVNTAISNLVDGAPALLDTLNEIAAAIGDDSNFVTTITNALATKLNITDAANTYLSKTDAPEVIQDKAAELFTHGFHQNVTATYDDVNNRINLAVAAQLTQEEAQDYIAPLFVHGLNPNINATYDDVANKLILETVIPPSKAIVSPSAPTNPANGEFWFDTDEYRTGNTRALKVWNAGTSTWEYVSSDLSLSTNNTWTSTNTFTNGIIIALDQNPTTGVHGQIYYNRITDKLKVFAGGLWQDVQVGEGGGGLALIPTDNTLPPSTFFVGLIAPPSGSTSSGDLWIDVDDIDTPFNQFFTGAVAPDPQQYEFWVDNAEPIQELIYSADEPITPSYPGELWIDTDEYDGAIVEFGSTPPNPDNVQLWVDINENESPSYYEQLSFPNYPTTSDFPPNAPNGFIAADAATGAAYVRTQGNWLKIVTASNINDTISANSSVFEDLKALAWMGFE